MRGRNVASVATESVGVEMIMALVLFGEVVGAEADPVVGGNKRLDLDVTLVLLSVLLRRIVDSDGVKVAAMTSDVAPSSVELSNGVLVDRAPRLGVSAAEEGRPQSVWEKLTVPIVLVMVSVMITTDAPPVTLGPTVPELVKPKGGPAALSQAVLLAVVGRGVADNGTVLFPAFGTGVEPGANTWLLEETRVVEFAHAGDGLTSGSAEEVASWLLSETRVVEFNRAVGTLVGATVDRFPSVVGGRAVAAIGMEEDEMSVDV